MSTNTSFFICSFKRDFPYLKYCVRSLNKFARGFHEVVIQIPDTDWDEFTSVIGPEIMGQDLIKYVPIAGPEWPGKGFLWHEAQVLYADTHCRNADFILHFDSDAILTEPVTPETFIKDGKPYLQYESYASIGQRHPGVLRWQECTQQCLPFDVLVETMRGLPHCYEINTYEKTRELMAQKTGMDCNEYIKQQRNEFPQTWAEHPTIGAVALQCFPNDYIGIDMEKQQNKDRSRWPVVQFWSHAPSHLAQNIWIYGNQKMVVPDQMVKEHGLY